MKLDSEFDPVLEFHSEGYQPRGRHEYLVLASWGDKGYIAKAKVSPYEETEVFQECRIPLPELEALKRHLAGIAIPLGHSLSAFDGGSGMIRIYHPQAGLIDFVFQNTEQPEWQPLLDFIDKVSERLIPEETFWPRGFDAAL